MKRINSTFFVLFIFSCLGINAGIVTNPGRRDGFGCQFFFIISAATYAELNHHTFRYAKFVAIDHNYQNDPEFLQKKEDLINFVGNFELAKNCSCPEEVTHFSYLASNLNKCVNTAVFKKIKRVFRENKNRDNFFDENKFHIAITIRRPNQHDVSSYLTSYPKFKYLIDETYLNIIDQLRQKYASYPLVFHLYSVGDVEEFRTIFNAPDIMLHINDSIENTFSSMVFADALVTFPRSAFSYTAALLSDGTIYHFETSLMPVPALPNWVKLENSLREKWKEEYERW